MEQLSSAIYCMAMRGQSQRFPKIGVNSWLKSFVFLKKKGSFKPQMSVKTGCFPSWRTLICPPLLLCTE